MRPLLVCLVVAVALPVAGQGTITGHVRDASGFGVASAEVRIAGGPLGAVTEASGAFKVQGVPAGTVKVTARRIGFRPGANDVTLTDGQTVEVTVVLEPTPLQLEQVNITARREPYDARLAGFRQRSQKRVGTFITRERIDASSSTSFSDLLRGVPGLKLVPSARSNILNAVRFRGQNCAPLVFIDGFPASADEFDVDIVDPSSVEGVEIYTGMLSVPAEFNAARGLERCGVIAIWSRPFRPPPKQQRVVSHAELQKMVESQAVFTAAEVDSVARIEPASFAPVYPDSLWKTYTGGQALVEFVVDTYGRVELQYFSIVFASHAEFGEAVREALSRARFSPAQKGGRRVRQLVQLPTHFDRPKP